MRPVSRHILMVLTAVAATALAGCTGSLLNSRSQSPEHASHDASNSDTKLVGDFAAPYGTSYIRVEGPVLITSLAGTGSDPAPGPQRAALLADMQAHNVSNPSRVLASPNNALAWARAYLPPGVRKGDPLDVQVLVPPPTETTSLRGGWMMETQLKEMAVIAGQVHNGHVLAQAEGPVLVNPVAPDSDDTVSQLRGVVLGGGVALKSRSLGLVLRESDKSVFLSKQIGDVIDRRFHTYIRGEKQGVATPKTDAFIELEVHPRYKYNLGRYIQVVRSIAVFETPQEQLERLELLERQLLDPVTSGQAALRLEAIGPDAERVLKKGLESSDAEVRFYAAEALAYLDQSCAVPVLAETVKSQPALRAYALTALCALGDVQAADALRDLFDVSSAETRYGAFRALWAMNEHDPQLRGEHLSDKFWLYVVPSAGPPMVHVTHSFRPEIVLFGEGQKFTLPFTLEAGNSIIVKSLPDGQISVARFSLQKPDERRTVENSVAEVIRAIVEVGGDYPDAVQALEEAHAGGAAPSRFEVDAIPERGRVYDRNRTVAHGAQKDGSRASPAHGKSSGADADDSQTTEVQANQPLPNLFGGDAPKFSESADEMQPAAPVESDKKPPEDSPNAAAKPTASGVK
ncbi:MAG TPA: HEAT repeat domain-containing protein [Pirellulales bacterium]|nr:HEAT repeat domain-containing protein [Pirellulales bacterium]